MSSVNTPTTSPDARNPQTGKHGLFIVVMVCPASPKASLSSLSFISSCSTLWSHDLETLRIPFIDGDDLHPKSNVDKMSRGEPLTDEDRAPWLDIIRTTAQKQVHGQRNENSTRPDSRLKTENASEVREAMTTEADKQLDATGIIVACSALKRSYRDLLRGHEKSGTVPSHSASSHPNDLPTYFVYLKGGKDELMDRMQRRKGHFMKAEMLKSQLETLESPEGEEGVIIVPIGLNTEEQVGAVINGLQKLLGEF